jgi:hypothetical protein
MKPGFGAVASAACLALFLTASCRTGPGGLVLPRLKAAVDPPGTPAQLTGRLFRSGACLAVEGNGSTVIVWPRTANARSSPGNGNVIVVWPRAAVADTEGNGTIVIIWPFGRMAGRPLRTGEPVELQGIIMADDIAGFAHVPAEPGCRGPGFVVREGRPARR